MRTFRFFSCILTVEQSARTGTVELLHPERSIRWSAQILLVPGSKSDYIVPEWNATLILKDKHATIRSSVNKKCNFMEVEESDLPHTRKIGGNQLIIREETVFVETIYSDTSDSDTNIEALTLSDAEPEDW